MTVVTLIVQPSRPCAIGHRYYYCCCAIMLILTTLPPVSGPTPRMEERSAAFNSEETRTDWLAGAKALAPAMALNKTAIFILTRDYCYLHSVLVAVVVDEVSKTNAGSIEAAMMAVVASLSH
jgi:hypothetical protein